jgi:hypothetical protein
MVKNSKLAYGMPHIVYFTNPTHAYVIQRRRSPHSSRSFAATTVILPVASSDPLRALEDSRTRTRKTTMRRYMSTKRATR